MTASPRATHRNRLVIAGLLLGVVFLLWYGIWHTTEVPATSEPNTSPSTPKSVGTVVLPHASPIHSHTPAPQSTQDDSRSPLADDLNDANGTVHDDLRILREIVLLYHLEYKENPIGDHEEVVAALTGHNPHLLAFIPVDHPALHEGKLLDRWGHPYRFHALSRDLMEIISAGPDGKFATEDDVMIQE